MLKAVMAAAVSLFLMLACETEEQVQEAIQHQEPEVRVSSAELVAAYEADEAAADSRFEGRVVEVAGPVAHIGLRLLEFLTPTIVLAAGGERGGVKCLFTAGSISEVSTLIEGQRVTLKGRVQGKVGVHIVVRGRTIIEALIPRSTPT